MKTDNITLWQKRIADKKASGMKLDEWCAQNQLTKHSYYYWKRKITDLERNESDAPLFVEVPTEPADHTNMVSGTMQLEWNGVTIHVTDSHTVSLAAELLTKLQKLC